MIFFGLQLALVVSVKRNTGTISNLLAVVCSIESKAFPTATIRSEQKLPKCDRCTQCEQKLQKWDHVPERWRAGHAGIGESKSCQNASAEKLAKCDRTREREAEAAGENAEIKQKLPKCDRQMLCKQKLSIFDRTRELEVREDVRIRGESKSWQNTTIRRRG